MGFKAGLLYLLYLFKIILIYLLLGLGAGPEFIQCLSGYSGFLPQSKTCSLWVN